MPDPISTDQSLEIARLARIALAPTEAEPLAAQLSRVLEYVDQLQSVDTTGVEPDAQGRPSGNVAREDESRAGLTPEQALANAPQQSNGFFVVPAVLDESGS